jgi:hypothetical protein
MKTTLLEFLITEGGKATEKWGTSRATKKDIEQVLKVISQASGISIDDLTQNLLGTSRLTLQGKRSSSGDIDLTISSKNFPEIHRNLSKQVHNRAVYNTGTKVASYAIETQKGKLVQVDLMPSDKPEFSHFMYFSSEGDKSKYKGAVRNIMLMTLATFILEKGKDFAIRDEEGHIIARASRSLKLNVGLERLFKVAKMRKDGKGRTKSLTKVSPEDLDNELQKIDPSKIGAYDQSPDIVNDPDKIAHFFFGKSVNAKDIMTAEQVAKQINDKYSGKELKEIKEKIKDELTKSNFEVPTEL